MKLWTVICKLQYYTYIQQKCGQKPKAKSQVKPKPKSQQKPKAKSQVKPKPKPRSQRPKAKSQVGMQMGDLLQNAANSTQIRDCGFKMQQIAREAAPD